MKRKRLGRVLRWLVLYPLASLALLATLGYGYWYATLYSAGAAQEGALALTHAMVLVGEGLEPQPDTTVLVQDGVIVAVGADGTVAIPAGATTLDLSGYTLMPGLMDLHVHLSGLELGAGEQMGPAQIPGVIFDALRYAPGTRRALLHHGVTTVRDVGNELDWIMELRQGLRSGELEGPRLFAAGPVFTTPGGHPVVTLFAGEPEPNLQAVRLPQSAEEARTFVQALAGGTQRVDLIKVIQERGRPERPIPLEPIPPDVLHAIVAEAHAQGLPVTAHWGTLQDLEEVLAAEVDGLEHVGRLLEPWPAALLASAVARDVALTPTLVVMEVKLPPDTLAIFQARVAEFHAAGGRVVVGSDAGIPGVRFGGGVHRELELLVASGLTPQAALRAATSDAARVLRAPHLGAIAPGRAADLLVVAGDPTQDIQATQNVIMVFRDGRLVVDRRTAP